jgi:hypothetical protein
MLTRVAFSASSSGSPSIAERSTEFGVSASANTESCGT